MKVLIGYDGSQCSDDALLDLQRAGLPAIGTETMVLSLADVLAPAASADAHQSPAVILKNVQRIRALVAEAVERARQCAEAGAQRLRDLFPDWSITAQAAADSPHWGLVHQAADWKADLLVVGSRGRSTVTRVLFGSVSQLVLHYSPCSVRIARCPATPAQTAHPVRLLLGVDGSPDSAAAVSAVAARPWPARTEVHVVSVFDSGAILSALDAGPADAASDRKLATPLEQIVQNVAAELRRTGLTATTTLLAGDPKELLLSEAQRIDADCIFVGAKGHSRLQRLVVGSVSASISARAPCSVEVVRQG